MFWKDKYNTYLTQFTRTCLGASSESQSKKKSLFKYYIIIIMKVRYGLSQSRFDDMTCLLFYVYHTCNKNVGYYLSLL